MTEVRVEVRGAVRELFKSDDPLVCVSGPAGTGKSYGALLFLHLTLLKHPGTRALLLRKTHTSLTSTTLVTFKEKVVPEAIEAGILHWYGGSGSEPASFRYDNGSRIVVGGLDRPEKVLSSEYSIIMVDEAIELSRTDVDVLKTRLRGATSSYPHYRLILMTNPGPPTHHLKTSSDVRMLYSVHEDNPSLYRDEQWTPEGLRYLESLESMTGVRYERLRWGRWSANDGIIYPDFDPNTHEVPRYEIPRDWDRYLVVDFGFKHPFVAQWWAADPDGRLVMYREIYKTETLVEDHARLIKELSEGEPSFRDVIADHHAENRASLERHLGVQVTPAKKTVKDGIDAVQSRLKPQQDGLPRIFFQQDALVEEDRNMVDGGGPRKTTDEFSFYTWSKKDPEKPDKIHDDGMDCVRYMVAHLDLVEQRGIRRVRGFGW